MYLTDSDADVWIPWNLSTSLWMKIVLLAISLERKDIFWPNYKENMIRLFNAIYRNESHVVPLA